MVFPNRCHIAMREQSVRDCNLMYELYKIERQVNTVISHKMVLFTNGSVYPAQKTRYLVNSIMTRYSCSVFHTQTNSCLIPETANCSFSVTLKDRMTSQQYVLQLQMVQQCTSNVLQWVPGVSTRLSILPYCLTTQISYSNANVFNSHLLTN